MWISYKRKSPICRNGGKSGGYNKEKFKVVHLGRGNPAQHYHMANTPLFTTEADLGGYLIRLPVKVKAMPIATEGSRVEQARWW